MCATVRVTVSGKKNKLHFRITHLTGVQSKYVGVTNVIYILRKLSHKRLNDRPSAKEKKNCF